MAPAERQHSTTTRIASLSVSSRPPPAALDYTTTKPSLSRPTIISHPCPSGISTLNTHLSLSQPACQSSLLPSLALDRSLSTPPELNSYLPPRIIIINGEEKGAKKIIRLSELSSPASLAHSVCLAASWILDSQSNSHKRQEVCLLLVSSHSSLAPHCDCDHSLIGRLHRATFQ